MEKEQKWQEINELRAKIAQLEVQLNTIGRQFAKDYCGFKVGQKVIALNECAIVTNIFFDPDCHESSMAAIHVEFYTENWDRPQKNRNKQILRRKGGDGVLAYIYQLIQLGVYDSN